MKNLTLVCEVLPNDKGFGYLSKELINKMLVAFKRTGHSLTDLYISQKDADDITKWVDTDIDPVDRRKIFQEAKTNHIWSLNIHKIQRLNKHISGKDQIFGFDFKNNTLSENQKLCRVKKCFSGNSSKLFGIGLINRKAKIEYLKI